MKNIVVDIVLKNNKGTLKNCKICNGVSKFGKELNDAGEISNRLVTNFHTEILFKNEDTHGKLELDDIETFSVHDIRDNSNLEKDSLFFTLENIY